MNLKELATSLGLSQTTVSRALNGFPEVNESTRQRVTDAALRLGYQPNANAVRLATGHVGAVGIVYSTIDGYGPHTSEFLGGLGERLARNEIDVLVSTVVSLTDELSAYRRAVQTRKVDCFIVHSPRPDDPRVELLNELGLPFVLHGRTQSRKPVAFLDIDNYSVTRRGALQLASKGHHDIALINGPKGFTLSDHREAGYRTALLDSEIDIRPELVRNGLFSDEIGFSIAKELLAISPRPTAILAGSMMTALGVARAVRAAGLTLGRDISMIAHDEVFPYLHADSMLPSMSTTRSSMRAAGSRIAEMAIDLLAGANPESLQETWPVELIVRQSTGPVPI